MEVDMVAAMVVERQVAAVSFLCVLGLRTAFEYFCIRS